MWLRCRHSPFVIFLGLPGGSFSSFFPGESCFDRFEDSPEVDAAARQWLPTYEHDGERGRLLSERLPQPCTGLRARHRLVVNLHGVTKALRQQTLQELRDLSLRPPGASTLYLAAGLLHVVENLHDHRSHISRPPSSGQDATGQQRCSDAS